MAVRKHVYRLRCSVAIVHRISATLNKANSQQHFFFSLVQIYRQTFRHAPAGYIACTNFLSSPNVLCVQPLYDISFLKPIGYSLYPIYLNTQAKCDIYCCQYTIGRK